MKYIHIMKIIVVPKISLKTLHLGIPKQELNKGSLVASVFYFSRNTDVVSNRGIPKHLDIGLWFFYVLVHLVISGGDHSGFLIPFSVLAVETLFLLLLLSQIINLIGMCLIKSILRIKVKHLVFRLQQMRSFSSPSWFLCSVYLLLLLLSVVF